MEYELEDMIAVFGSKAKIAAAFGLSRQHINAWGNDIPDMYQVRFYRKFKADRLLMAKYRQVMQAKKIENSINDQ
jgi:hypothetical protein